MLLDLDSTDDPTPGEQEGALYHGYYGQHMYHPLLVFDGGSGQLITAVLRQGNSHAGRGAVAVLKRLVDRLREAWPAAEMEIRADAGFALPAIYEWCEREEIGYTIGLVPNPRLERLAEPLLERAERESGELAGEKVRLVADAPYRAGSWDRPRRVGYKAEAMEQGTNTRFVVTSRRSAKPKALYDWYVRRGGRLDKGLQAGSEGRPPQLPPHLPGQPIPAFAARGGLLAIGRVAKEADRGGHTADAAGYA